MRTIPGYRMVDILSETGHSTVIRAVDEQTGQPVILKILTLPLPKPSDIASFTHEFNLIRNLNFDGVPTAIGLLPYKNGRMMVFEDHGAVSLDRIMAEKTFPLPEVLTIGIRVSDILDRLHQLNIIHMAINPSHIVINPDTGEVKLIDFGMASSLTHENAEIRSPRAMDGSLAHISPEQTGRMGRSIDYRTDFYSLGTTLYELLCGRPPFVVKNDLDLIHAHLTMPPVLPDSCRSTVPAPVFRIIKKLMAKSAEGRYLSAKGISLDFWKCLTQWMENGRIRDFEPGSRDISLKFILPQTLYGRARESGTLLKAFDHIRSGDRKLVLVEGASGTGKSMLIKEMYASVISRSGFFISGKCDRFKQSIPFDPLIQACRQLIRRILNDSECLDSWQRNINRALDTNGRVVTNLIPELTQIIGPQPRIPDLPPQESNNRFLHVFKNFIRVFAGQSHPLVLFIDDLQWTDESSAMLINDLMGSENTRFLMVVCAYRAHEIDHAHPLYRTLDDMKNRLSVDHVRLGNLHSQDVKAFVKDVLRHDTGDDVRALTAFCMDKTDGNPFDLIQCLSLLYKHGSIVFNIYRGRWEFDHRQNHPVVRADHVSDFLAERVHTLLAPTLAMLRLASCIGDTFNIKILHRVSGSSVKEIVAALWDALLEGLIAASGQTPGLLKNKGGISDIAWIDPALSFRFTHDRIRQAAYATMDENKAKDTHLAIGTLMLENSTPLEREKNVFDIVNHLNKGITRSNDATLALTLAELNLLSARKAATSAAFRSALTYAATGLNLLPGKSWSTHYALALDLHTRAAEAACFCNEEHLLKTYSQDVITHARSFTDTVTIHETAIHASIARGDLIEAVNTALVVLNKLGIHFPEIPGPRHLIKAVLRTRFRLIGKRIRTLAALPEMADKDTLAAMKILSAINAAALAATPDLFPLLVMKQVELSAGYGNAEESIHAYVCYGAGLCGNLDIERGYEFGRLAVHLLNRFQAKAMTARVTLFNNYMIRHWKEPLQALPPSYLEGYQTGLNTGDLEYAAFCRLGYFQTSFQLSGKPVQVLSREMDEAAVVFNQIRYKQSIMVMSIARQVCRNLMGQTDSPHILKGEVYDEDRMLPIHQKARDHMLVFIHYYWKLYLAYLFRDYYGAFHSCQKADDFIREMISTQLAPGFYLFDALARLAVYESSPSAEKRLLLKKVSSNLGRIQIWARHCPENFLAKLNLILAERARVLNQNNKAMSCYTSAISHAHDYGLVQEEALAHELAAGFFQKRGTPVPAESHILDAHRIYRELGFKAKVDQLEGMHPHVFKTESVPVIKPTGMEG